MIAFWIINGDKYRAEAETSAASVAKQMPGVRQVIFTLEDFKETVKRNWFVTSILCLNKAIDRFAHDEKLLWLDSDTYMCEPVPELFQMLDRFDLVMAHAPGHFTAPTVNQIPDAFPEFNIGVVAMNNLPKIRTLWQLVSELQGKHPDVYGDNDQSPLREALWERHDISIGVMPNEYNVRFNFGAQIRGRVKILHGHTLPGESYEAVARSINQGYREGYQIPPRNWSRNDVS